MPTATFQKLPEEKKKKIIEAAKNEFARVSFHETSIQRIVQEAGIARGSFYQYFQDKEDLLEYILSSHVEEINKNLEEALEKGKGDLFQVFINMYDYLVEECVFADESKFFKKIFENIKTVEDNLFSIKMGKYKPKSIFDYYEEIDKDNLKIESKEDFEIIVKLLFCITKKAAISNIKSDSKQEMRKVYLKQLEYIKHGVLKN